MVLGPHRILGPHRVLSPHRVLDPPWALGPPSVLGPHWVLVPESSKGPGSRFSGKTFLPIITFQFLFHFRGRRRLFLFNGFLFLQEIPKELILLCMDSDVAFRL